MKHACEKMAQAIGLRQEGKSLLEVSTALGISKSTASIWLRDIPMNREQHYGGGNEFRGVYSQNRRDIRRGYQEEGRRMAELLDVEYSYGCMLYWAEGNKQKNSVGFCNGDADMMSFFVKFLRRYFGCKDNDLCFSVMAHTGDGLGAEDINRYWSEKLGVPMSRCGKFVLKTKYYPKPVGVLRKPYGCCTVRVHDTKIVQNIFGSIKKLMGLDGDRWLD